MLRVPEAHRFTRFLGAGSEDRRYVQRESRQDRRSKTPSLLSGDEEEEFDSPETIMALHSVLQELGHEVQLLGDGEELLHHLLEGQRPDLVLNIAEGRGSSRSREARVPAVLEMLGIPHTGSDPLTLAVTLDKDCAKRLVRDAGLATPAWVLVDRELTPELEQRLDRLSLPAFIKPAFEGSSKGILSSSLVYDRAELLDGVARLYDAYRQPILVEEFIDGEELTVGILGNDPPEVLGIMRVVPQDQVGPVRLQPGSQTRLGAASPLRVPG